MENYFIVLISIGFVLYNLYKNYQKEMEKSRSRKPNVRPQTIPSENNIPPKQKVKTKEIKFKQKEVVVSEIPTEVLAAQQRRKSYHAKKPIAIKPPLAIDVEKSDFEFDLRRAVIQSVILERPYK